MSDKGITTENVAPAQVTPNPEPVNTPTGAEGSVPVAATDPAPAANVETPKPGDNAPAPEVASKADSAGDQKAAETSPTSEPAKEKDPTLLGKPTAADTAVQGDTKAAGADKSAGAGDAKLSEVKDSDETNKEGGQTEEPAPPPSYDAFALPEDVKLDDAKVKEFTNLLSELEVGGKADHAAVQAFGQKAVDFYLSEMKRSMEDYNKAVYDAWDKQKTEWKEAFLHDPDMGGNRSQTTVDAARNFIRTHGGTPEQQEEFRNLMESSGLGNHPAMIRLLANAYRDLAEGKPLAATRPVSAPKSKTATLYGGKS